MALSLSDREIGLLIGPNEQADELPVVSREKPVGAIFVCDAEGTRAIDSQGRWWRLRLEVDREVWVMLAGDRDHHGLLLRTEG